MARVEPYVRPAAHAPPAHQLLHLNRVLRFIHLQPIVKDAAPGEAAVGRAVRERAASTDALCGVACAQQRRTHCAAVEALGLQQRGR